MTQSPQPPPLTLDYQRLDRARKTAIGGLRLLGILTAVAAMALLALAIFSLVRSRFPFSIRFLLPFGIFASVVILGMLKFICSMLIARRSRAAAIAGLAIVLLEAAALCYPLYKTFELLRDDPLDPLANRIIRFAMLLLALLGWLAVAYEILHVIRHEQRE